MPSPEFSAIKDRINDVAAFYGIEVVGYLKLDRTAVIPEKDIDLLKGVRWSDGHVDVENVQDPAQIMPGAKAMIILGKRLQDDRHDVYYRVSDRYTASVEMMVLDMASVCVAGLLQNEGFRAHGVYFLLQQGLGRPRRAGLDWQVPHVRLQRPRPPAAPEGRDHRRRHRRNTTKSCPTIPAATAGSASMPARSAR